MYGVSKKPKLSVVIIRIVVGIIFLSEVIQKLIRPDEVGTGRFAKIGFTHPCFWAYFTGSFGIVCAALILPGILTRLCNSAVRYHGSCPYYHNVPDADGVGFMGFCT